MTAESDHQIPISINSSPLKVLRSEFQALTSIHFEFFGTKLMHYFVKKISNPGKGRDWVKKCNSPNQLSTQDYYPAILYFGAQGVGSKVRRNNKPSTAGKAKKTPIALFSKMNTYFVSNSVLSG